MSKDPISDRFEIKRKQEKLDDMARKSLSKEELEAQEKLLKETEKADTIRKEKASSGRNDPCHCGSGKKYKHCHGK